MTTQTLRVIDGETEKLCRKCGEWWPATTEYFYSSSTDKAKLYSPCKACIAEKRQETSAVKPCCVPGCTKPRYSWRFARCWEHRYNETVVKPRRLEASQKS